MHGPRRSRLANRIVTRQQRGLESCKEALKGHLGLVRLGEDAFTGGWMRHDGVGEAVGRLSDVHARALELCLQISVILPVVERRPA